MGSTASARPAKPTPTSTTNTKPGAPNGSSSSSATATSHPAEGHHTKDTTAPTLTEPERAALERKQYLKKKLRSKIRAIAAFRSSVKVATEDEGNGSLIEQQGDEGLSEAEDEGGIVAEQKKRGLKLPGAMHSLDILYHPSNNREHLKAFLWKRKQETESCWNSITTSMSEDVNEKYSIRDRRLDGEGGGGQAAGGRVERRRGEKIPDELRLPPAMAKVDNDSVCDLCGKVAAFSVPCRICTNVYHKKCLEKSGRYRDEDSGLIDRSTTEEGWSCYNCDNLCLLLTAEETAEMMEDFDTYDINRDESISLVEFVRFKKRQYLLLDGHDMPEEEEQLVRAQFERMDTDNSGEVDFWEFMRFEARRFLARKAESDLAAMLTAKELLAARSVYLGKIGTCSEPESTYLQGVFLGAGIATWDDFLCDQALYILWSRANRDHSLVI